MKAIFLALLLLPLVGCATTDFNKGVEVIQKVCNDLDLHQDLIRLGTDAALSSAKALEANLIVHDTLDGLLATCALAGKVIDRHEEKGKHSE